MSDWAPKRFWKDTEVVTEGEAFEVRLDGRPVNTPGKRRLTLPTATMADKVAAEWDAQAEVIDPRTMPWTRSANSALDKVAPQMAEVAEHLAEYAATDMVSYRADHPDALIARQAATWDPLIDRVADAYGARLLTTAGVMPVAQDPTALARLRATMDGFTPWQMTGFHDLVTLPGSFVVALAAINEWQGISDLWDVARLDELWQIEQWGIDEEAEALAARKRDDFLHAAAFFRHATLQG